MLPRFRTVFESAENAETQSNGDGHNWLVRVSDVKTLHISILRAKSLGMAAKHLFMSSGESWFGSPSRVMPISSNGS